MMALILGIAVSLCAKPASPTPPPKPENALAMLSTAELTPLMPLLTAETTFGTAEMILGTCEGSIEPADAARARGARARRRGGAMCDPRRAAASSGPI